MKKAKIKIITYLDADVVEELKTLANIEQLPLSIICRRIILSYLRSQGNKNENP